MSLINDALKKAQRQREGPGATPPGPLPPTPPSGPLSSTVATPSPAGKNNVALIIAGAAVIVSLSVAATVYFLRKEPQVDQGPSVARIAPKTPVPPANPPSPAAGLPSPLTGSSAVASTPAGSSPTAPELKSSAESGTTKPEPTPSTGASNVARTESSPTPSPAVPTTTPTPLAAGQTAPPLPTAMVATPAPAIPDASAVKSTYRIQGMVDKFRISGIRLADTDSKVLLNDHLFRVNDLVEASLGLRLTAIESHVLTFTDADGNVYLKRF